MAQNQAGHRQDQALQINRTRQYYSATKQHASAAIAPILGEIFKFFFSESNANSGTVNENRRNDQCDGYSSAENMNLIDRIISTPKIKWAIDISNPFKSSGLQGIIPAMLQHSSAPIAPILGDFFKGLSTSITHSSTVDGSHRHLKP